MYLHKTKIEACAPQPYEISVEDLFFYTKIEPDKRFKDFRKWILEPSIEEINKKTNIFITYYFLQEGALRSKCVAKKRCHAVCFQVIFEKRLNKNIRSES